MSASSPAIRFILLAATAVGSAVGVGWTVGRFQAGAIEPAPDLIRTAGFIDLHGAEPPPLTLVDAKGTTVNVSDLRGKLVLLHFWGTGCIHCVTEVPALNELAKAHAGQIVVLHVCATNDDPAAAQQMLDRVAPGTVSHGELTGLGLARFEANSLPKRSGISSTRRMN